VAIMMPALLAGCCCSSCTHSLTAHLHSHSHITHTQRHTHTHNHAGPSQAAVPPAGQAGRCHRPAIAHHGCAGVKARGGGAAGGGGRRGGGAAGGREQGGSSPVWALQLSGPSSSNPSALAPSPSPMGRRGGVRVLVCKAVCPATCP